jgi:hypothetical protein
MRDDIATPCGKHSRLSYHAPLSRRSLLSIFTSAMATTVKYSDIGKSVSDLLGRDYPAGTVKLEVNTKAENGVVSRRVCVCALVIPYAHLSLLDFYC